MLCTASNSCVACDNTLFDSVHKFDSGTGWPSFTAPVEGGIVLRQSAKDKLFQQREVLCSLCQGHLGHVFRDGPAPPKYERYCINGVAMKFIPRTST